MNQERIKYIWKIERKRRKIFLRTESCCKVYDGLIISKASIIKNTKSVVEKITDDKITDVPSEEISEGTLKTAADMFTYLNFCPTKLFSFYTDLFTSATPKEIILALTSIMKSSVSEAHRRSSIKIFDKTTNILKLYNYKDIEILTLGDYH